MVCCSRHLDLEPLALPNTTNVTETEPLAGARDRLTLRVVNLRLEHDLNDDPGHLSCLSWMLATGHAAQVTIG
jgi:hypothetical protein